MHTLVSNLKHTFNNRSATPEDEALFIEMDAGLDRAHLPEDGTFELDDEARARLGALDGCGDVLRCVLSYHDSEEPLFYLDGALAPLWAIISAAPFVDIKDQHGEVALSQRRFARVLLDAATLLGGDARLGILRIVADEEGAAQDDMAAAYVRGLARLASLTRWAVGALERAAEDATFEPESVAESAPALAAARLELALRAWWPSARASWSLTMCLPDSVRGEQARWEALHARIEALSSLIADAEQAQAGAAGDAAVGDLVLIPRKGVSVVLEALDDVDVVAAYGRPARSTTWYPAGKLARVDCPARLHKLLGAPSPASRQREQRHHNDVVWKLRSKSRHHPVSYVAQSRRSLDEGSGLERYTSRASYDEHIAPRSPMPPSIHNASDGFKNALLEQLVACDPLLGAVALEWARGVAAATPPQGDEAHWRRLRHELLMLIAWWEGEPWEAHAAAYAAEMSRADARGDMDTLLRLASMERWDTFDALLRDGALVAELKQRSDIFSDTYDPDGGVSAGYDLDMIRAMSACIEARRAGCTPDADAIGAARDSMSQYCDHWSLSLDMLHWLRLWHGARGLSPQELLLCVYIEWPYQGMYKHSRIPRLPPPEHEAEVARLRALLSPPHSSSPVSS